MLTSKFCLNFISQLLSEPPSQGDHVSQWKPCVLSQNYVWRLKWFSPIKKKIIIIACADKHFHGGQIDSQGTLGRCSSYLACLFVECTNLLEGFYSSHPNLNFFKVKYFMILPGKIVSFEGGNKDCNISRKEIGTEVECINKFPELFVCQPVPPTHNNWQPLLMLSCTGCRDVGSSTHI